MLANKYSCRWNTFFRGSWFAIIKEQKSIFASDLCRTRFGASLFGNILIYWLQYGKQFVKQRRWEGHNDILFACIHKRSTFLIYMFSSFYDSLTETACKKFPPALFVSDWLEFLIHIHSVHRISHISDCSLMSEDVSSNWRPVFLLEEEAALCWKNLTFRRNFQLISMKSKYCFWITFPKFVRKATWIPNCYSIE